MSDDSRQWRSWLFTFLVTVFASGAALPFVGNVLPGRYGSYMPMLPGHDFVRDEFVRVHPMTDTPSPCVALLGDSRVAFNISAAIIDKSLPAHCKSQNYGFPTLTRQRMVQFASELSISEMIVISLSETMLANESDTLDATSELLELRTIRWIYIGYQRVANLYRLVTRANYPDSGWSWLSSDKRWQDRWLEKRVLANEPKYDEETSAMAASYFKVNRQVDEEQLRRFLAALAARTKRVVIVIPPSEARFQQEARQYNDGIQEKYWDAIRRLAASSDVPLIDCSRSCVDQSSFGDPVHLNAKGAELYSSILGRLIAAL